MIFEVESLEAPHTAHLLVPSGFSSLVLLAPLLHLSLRLTALLLLPLPSTLFSSRRLCVFYIPCLIFLLLLLPSVSLELLQIALANTLDQIKIFLMGTSLLLIHSEFKINRI